MKLIVGQMEYSVGFPDGKVVKLIHDEQEFVDYFRLRYEEWARSSYLSQQSKNKSRLEINSYDLVSLHFGCFLNDGTLVSTLRLITPEAIGLLADAVRDVRDVIRRMVKRSNDKVLDAVLEQVRPKPVPIAETFPESVLRGVVVDNPHGLVEFSRSVSGPKRKGHARSLLEFGFASAIQLGIPQTVASCVIEHLPIWRKIGFAEIPTLEYMREKQTRQVAVAIHVDLKELPEQTWKGTEYCLNEIRRCREN